MNHAINNKAKRPWVSRVRFQLLGGMFFAVVLPILFRPFSMFEVYLRGNEFNTIAGAILSVVIGYVMTRRLSNFPSVTAGSYVIISFSVSYLITAGIFLMFRLDYSRLLFLISFIFCMFWFVLVYFLVKRMVKIKYAIVPGGNARDLAAMTSAHWTVLGSPEEYKTSFGSVVVDLRHNHQPEWERFVADCALRGVPVYHTKQVKESLTGKVEIEHLSENMFGSLLPNLIYLRLKLTIDVIVAILVLPFVLAILAIAGTAILLTSGRPIFFKQKRMGFRGSEFTVYKLRTMQNACPSKDSSDSLPEQQERQDTIGRDYAMTQSDDKRITRLGAFLRKYRIDELPQIFNILKGDMSWIGPRPEAVVLSEWYENELPFYHYRHIVRPGISGWAQVNQGHVAEVDQVGEKLHYDFFYIKNLSAWLDFLIVLKTLRIISSGFGAK